MFAIGLNLSPLYGIVTHCYNDDQIINLILGSFDSDKTALVSKLGDVLVLSLHGPKNSVAAVSDSA